MGKEIKLKLRGGVFFILLLVPVFIGGYYSGKLTGSYAVKKMVTDGGGIFFLLFRPAHQFFQVYRMLNSNSEVIRLSGYYSMLDNNIIDEEFLEKRYLDERSIPVKRSIIWLMGFSGDFEEIKKFFNEIYDESPREVKREILRIFQRRDPVYFKDFTGRKKGSRELSEY
jgi:hypothetical protein